MSGLEDFQKKFISGLLAGEKTDSRLDVYRTIVAENHRSALSDTYPVCEQLVGPDYLFTNRVGIAKCTPVVFSNDCPVNIQECT